MLYASALETGNSIETARAEGVGGEINRRLFNVIGRRVYWNYDERDNFFSPNFPSGLSLIGIAGRALTSFFFRNWPNHREPLASHFFWNNSSRIECHLALAHSLN